MKNDLFNEFPEIKTCEVMLRKLNFNDIKDMFEIFSDSNVLKYNNILPHKKIIDTEELFFTFIRDYKYNKAINWGIINLENNKLIGICGLYNFDYKFTRAEIRFEVNRAYCKQEYIYKALKEIIKFGFENTPLQRIEAIVNDEDEISKDTLEKLKFKYEGCLRKRFYFNSEFKDKNYFGLLKEEWK